MHPPRSSPFHKWRNSHSPCDDLQEISNGVPLVLHTTTLYSFQNCWMRPSLTTILDGEPSRPVIDVLSPPGNVRRHQQGTPVCRGSSYQYIGRRLTNNLLTRPSFACRPWRTAWTLFQRQLARQRWWSWTPQSKLLVQTELQPWGSWKSRKRPGWDTSWWGILRSCRTRIEWTNVWDLSERLINHESRVLLFAFGQVDLDQLIWDIFFLAEESDKTRACGRGKVV